jgi:hypothetical protein
MRAQRWLGRAVLSAGLILTASCDSPQSLGPAISIQDFLPYVTSSDGSVQAVLHAGAAPAPAGGPDAAATGVSTVVTGGSAQIALASAGSFDRIIVAIAGVDGYWELALPSGTSASDLVFGVSQSLPNTTFRALYGAVGGGATGAYAEQDIRVIRVGTGDVQVSISWTGKSDVDLHIFEPSGEEVYFGHTTSATGGNLDLDSNAGCSIDDVNNENIVWPTGAAPHGTYRVVVDYWSDCAAERSDWVVTVQAKGQAPRTFTGSFVGDNTPYRSVQVTTFDY